MGNLIGGQQSMLDSLTTYFQQISLCLRPEYESEQLTRILQHYENISLYSDPYYGDCYALEAKQNLHSCVMIKETIDKKIYNERLSVLAELNLGGEGPTNQNVIKTTVIANMEKSGFLWKKQEIYLVHDFILVDLKKEFENRVQNHTYFSEEDIKTIIRECTKGFLRLELTGYRSVRMQHIYFCGDGKEIKLAHPLLFNYRSNLSLLVDDYTRQDIYLSPEEMEYLERNDSNYECGWCSNAFSFGMVILSLMTMKNLNEVYDYRACQINFHKIGQYIKSCNKTFSYHLVTIVQELLEKRESSRLNFKNLLGKLNQKSSNPIELTLLEPEKVVKQLDIIQQNKGMKEHKYPNYISAFLKPKVTLAGEYLHLNEDQEENMFSNDAVIANERLRYSKKTGEVIGQYMGDTTKLDKSKDGSIVRQGKGLYEHPDGQSYIGEWKQGKMDGYGKLFYSNKKLRYEGEFKDGKFHGNGTEYSQLQIPEREEEIDEQYVKIFRGNWIKYEGYYKHDLKQGAGKIFFKKGFWKGNFKEGQPNGQGIYRSYNNSHQTPGTWIDGQLVRPNY